MHKNNNESRKKAQDHLKQLIKNAKKIVIKDNYCDKCLYDIKNILDVDQNCIIEIYAEEKAKNNIKRLLPNAQYKKYDNATMHDRYIIIDDKIEIILTSGFQYLFKNNKELTYIITEN